MEDKMPSQEKATEESGLIKTTTRRKARAKAQVVQEEKEKQERVATKKDLVTYYCPKTHLIRIKFEGGGQVPKELQTAFTKPFHAEQAIERYFNRRSK